MAINSTATMGLAAHPTLLYPTRIRDLRQFGFTDVLFPGQVIVDD